MARHAATSNPSALVSPVVGDRAPSSRHWLSPASAFLVALLVRLLYLWQLRTSPLVDVVMGDSAVYDRWAREIAAGDWIGKEVFFQAPLYPYFVAVVYSLFGPSTWALRGVQMVIGALSCAVLATAAGKWFSPRVGWVSGILTALYAPAIFYDGLIQKEVLALFLVGVLVLLLALFEERGRWWMAAGMGAALGLLALTRENGLILVPIVTIWLFLRDSRDKEHSKPESSTTSEPNAAHKGRRYITTGTATSRGWTLAVFALGLTLVLAPVGVRNQVIGGRFLLTTSNMGSNLYIGNQPGARGYYLPLKEWRAEARFEQQDAKDLAEQGTGRTLTPGEVSRYWLGRTLTHIAAHPGEWVALLSRKWFMVWNASEHMDTESIEAYAEESWVLKALNMVLHFGLIVPLAAAGIWLTRAQWRRYAVWYAMVLGLAGSIALFFVFGRFRFPMVGLLIPLAAAGIVALIEHVRATNFRPVAASVIIMALVAAASNTARFRQYDPLAITWANVAGALSDRGRFDDAIAYYQRAQQASPNRPETFYGLAIAYERRGDDVEAEKYYRLALTGQDKPVDVLDKLANVLLRLEKSDEAAQMFARMVEVDPGSAETRYRAGFGFMQVGRRADAERQYREAVRINAHHAGALNNLGMMLAGDGKFAEAREYFLQALAITPDRADVHNNVGQSLLDEGRKDEARPYFEAALRLDPTHELAKENLAACGS